MAERKVLGYASEEIIELARTDEKLSDVLLVDSQDFEPEQFMLSSILLIALRAFQRFEGQGVPFGSITPDLIIDFAKRGETAIKDAAGSLQVAPNNSFKPNPLRGSA